LFLSLYGRAESILNTALAVLEFNKESWQRAGLPWPEK